MTGRTATRHRRVLVLVRLKDAGEGVDARRVGGAPLDRIEAVIASGLAAAFLAGVPLAATAARGTVFGSAARGLAGPKCGAANPAPPSPILTAAPSALTRRAAAVHPRKAGDEKNAV